MDDLADWMSGHGVEARVVAGPRGQRMVAVTTDVYRIVGERAEYAGTETVLVGTTRDALALLGY